MKTQETLNAVSLQNIEGRNSKKNPRSLETNFLYMEIKTQTRHFRAVSFIWLTGRGEAGKKLGKLTKPDIKV